MSGKLYLVATPIGNLEDITLRALRILRQVDIIAAEDTRNTLKLLNYFEISKPLFSYHRHNEDVKTKELIEKLIDGMDVALVSDAGTPVISDPGEEVVKEALKNEITVIPIPGACALITGLIASGMRAKEFTFMGFLPLNKKLRRKKLDEIEKETKTVILYEAPHKLRNTLEDIKDILKNRQVFLAKELTKIHEGYIKGTAEELLKLCTQPKGEFVIIIEASKENVVKKEAEILNDLSLEEHYEYYKKKGYEKKDIIKKIAKDRKVAKNEIYQIFM